MYEKLEALYREAPVYALKKSDRIVIFSDLHVGDGRRGDDFLENGPFFQYILERYYLKKNFSLILNGDIEELYRYSLREILNGWPGLYKLFAQFNERDALIKIYGNHDFELRRVTRFPFPIQPLEACRLRLKDYNIFLCHGHQGSFFMSHMHAVSRFFLRFFAKPLGIKNWAVAHDSNKKFKTEQHIYGYAKRKKIMAVIGHTHRPLFESLSKIDNLKFTIENLCRRYMEAGKKERRVIKRRIRHLEEDLEFHMSENRKLASRASLYNEGELFPCLFNSGCAIGKRGITAIEIQDGTVALVHWFDRKRSRKYLKEEGVQPKRLNKSDYYRVVLKVDELDYIFTRIKLLT